jgi:hypothetical protein
MKGKTMVVNGAVCQTCVADVREEGISPIMTEMLPKVVIRNEHHLTVPVGDLV